MVVLLVDDQAFVCAALGLLLESEPDIELHCCGWAVNAVALAPAEEFRRDSSLFLDCARNPEAQNRIKAAMKSGFQTREAEMALARMLGDLPGHA